MIHPSVNIVFFICIKIGNGQKIISSKIKLITVWNPKVLENRVTIFNKCSIKLMKSNENGVCRKTSIFFVLFTT